VVVAAQAFGLSRPVFYVTQELFQREGLPGLLPRKRGPKRPHKLTDEAMAVLVQAVQEAGRMLKGEELASLLTQRCGIEAHPRSILRRLRQEEKNAADGRMRLDTTRYTAQYELLRSEVIGTVGSLVGEYGKSAARNRLACC
jgi:hypothetical protein